MPTLTRPRRRAVRRPPPLTVARLVAELRELPHGLRTRVDAGLLVADVLEALGYGRRHVDALFGLGVGAVETATAAVRS